MKPIVVAALGGDMNLLDWGLKMRHTKVSLKSHAIPNFIQSIGRFVPLRVNKKAIILPQN